MSTAKTFKQALLASLITAVLMPVANSAESSAFRPNPDRVMPNPGMLVEDLRHFYGEPKITHSDLLKSDTEVWDYGTFRAFIADGIVQRSKLW